MPNLAGGQGYSSVVLAASAALGTVGVQAASAGAAAAIQGFLHTITVSADTNATTITVYDNTAGSGTVLAKIVTAATVVAQTFTFDLQAKTGLYVAISGGTAPNITVTYA